MLNITVSIAAAPASIISKNITVQIYDKNGVMAASQTLIVMQYSLNILFRPY